jgi:isochorismate synthase EntC
MKCVVAIRNVQWTGKCLQVSSGCGIVKESRVLNEWRELELKRNSIYRRLGVEL